MLIIGEGCSQENSSSPKWRPSSHVPGGHAPLGKWRLGMVELEMVIPARINGIKEDLVPMGGIWGGSPLKFKDSIIQQGKEKWNDPVQWWIGVGFIKKTGMLSFIVNWWNMLWGWAAPEPDHGTRTIDESNLWETFSRNAHTPPTFVIDMDVVALVFNWRGDLSLKPHSPY